MQRTQINIWDLPFLVVRKFRKTTIRFVMCVYASVRPFVLSSAWNKSAPTRRISMKFDV